MDDAKLRWVIAGLCLAIAVGYFVFLVTLYVAVQREMRAWPPPGAAKIPGEVVKADEPGSG